MSIQIIHSDILAVPLKENQYIVHQCNATGNRNMGLASLISKKYPTANLYSGKHKCENRPLGSIILRDNIVALIAQNSPGKPAEKDSSIMRLAWFKQALTQACNIPQVSTLYLPYGIGCGLAGGDWKQYSKAIEEIQEMHKGIEIVLVKLD